MYFQQLAICLITFVVFFAIFFYQVPSADVSNKVNGAFQLFCTYKTGQPTKQIENEIEKKKKEKKIA